MDYKLNPKVKEIADLLPEWELGKSQYEHGGHLVHKDNPEALIYIRLSGGGGGKGYAGGAAPQSIEGTMMSFSCWRVLEYGAKDPTNINFNPDKPADKIAKDIERRLIPVYMDLLTKALEKKAQDQEYQDKKDQDLKEVAKAAHYNLGEYEKKRQEFTVIMGNEVRATYDAGSSSLELRSISASAVKRVMELLSQLEAEEREATA